MNIMAVAVIALMALSTAGAAQTYSYGDRILYRDTDSSADGAWYRPGVFWDMRGDNVRFDYATGDQAFAPLTHVRPFNWVIGTEINCMEVDRSTEETQNIWTIGVFSAISMGNGDTSRVTIQQRSANVERWSADYSAYNCAQWLN
jgi:hypothetical protein